MEIKFGKFSKDMQAKIMAAFNNDNKIDESEARQLGLSKEQAEALMKELSGETESNTDKIEITKKDKDFSYTIVLNKNAEGKNEGILTWNGDSLAKIRTVYPNAKTPYLKDGVVTILDRDGNPVLDKNGKPLNIEYVQKQKIFSDELAEINVLGHKATPMEKLLHQAEIQNELNRLNSLPATEESYTEIMRSIAFEKMSKKEQTEAILKWTGEKFYAAKENGDIAAMKEYLVQGLGLAMQKMDMASIGSTNISLEGFKDFLKTWSGLNAFCEYVNNKVDDGSENLTKAEKIWEFTKGVGDAVDHFIGTQGVAFIGTLSLASEAAAAGGIGELWAVATQAYFGLEGVGSIAEGTYLLADADTSEEFRQAGDMVGTGAIMAHGAVKSFKSALTGKLQAGLSVNKALKEIKKAKTIDELKEIQDNMPDFPYSEQEKQVLMMECLKQSNKIITEGKEEPLSPNNTARTLEGGVKDTELTEVAPFSERLNKNLTPDDLIPERKTVELKNGELTPEGEFKSDGTRTVSETPFGKSETFKTMPDGKEKAIATTPKELKAQILSIIGGKKLSQNVRNNIDNLLKNPEVTIKDISEVIETLRYIEPKSTYAADFIISAIRRIENFQNFKTNLYTYAQFSTEMNNGYLKSARSYTWEPYSSKIQNFLRDRMNLEQLLKLDKTEPEALSQNIAKFSELGFILKETICYDRTNFSEYMFKSHSDKYFERLDYINEFNRAQYENKSKQFYTNIVTRGGLEDDANFAIINKNIEAYKSSLPYTGGQESLLYNSSTKEAEWLANFEAKIPEEKRTVAYNKYHWMVREDASKEIIDKYAEFIKAMPKEMLEGLENIRSHYPQYYENVFDSFHHIGYRQYKTHTQTPDELIIRAKMLAKCPSLAGRNGFKGFDSFKVSEFLCQTELKNSAAVLEFVEKAEPSALSKYHLDKESSNNKNFAEIMNEADLDLWTKNAKLHNELNPKYREHLNTGESLPVIGGWNEKFDFCYDLPTKEFKTRIDAINEYTEKLDMKTLDYVYVGKIKPERRILDVLTQLKPEVIENIDSYNSEKYINNLSDYSDNGLKNFVTFANKYADKRDLIRNINSESFRKIMNDLSENEIDILNKNILTHEHSSYFDPDTEMIKKRIASIPDKVKKYYRDKDNYLVEKYYGDRYFNEDGSLKENSPFKYLDTLSDTELKAIGTKAISEFVDRSVYSWSSVKEFDKERLKALTELPEQLLTKLEEGNKYSLLTKEEFTIDVQKITARYNDLVKFARFEELPGRIAGDICTMPDYSFNILKDVLKAHNDKLSTEDFDSICELIPRQDNFSQQEINYIREQLIHNPKNNPKDISRELQFLYSKYSTLASKPENRSFQKEILEDLINRGSKDNVQIERILQWIGNKEIETAKIVYDCALTAWEDPAVNPAEIGELISAITDNCEDFAYKAFHHPKFIGKKDKIHDILTHLKDDNKDFAGFMYLESDRFSVEDGNRILRGLTKENREFIENLCREGILSGKSIAKITEYTTCKNGNLGQAEKLLSSPEMKKWAEENINNNIDVETVIHLGRTQKNLYLEARQIQKAQDAQAKKEAARTVQQQNVKEEVFADVDAVETITKALAELNVPEGMAKNAYAKLCVDSSGNVDKIKLDAAKSLIKAYGFYTRVNKKGQTAINPNLTPKDITEIFKLATGDKMSTQNGMFRPHVIKDIITLKECGIDDIRFAMNLASIKNMDLIEMKARFKGETRQDIAHRINALVSNKVKETLNSRGIDLEEIREKALTSDRKIEDAKFKEGRGKAEVRTLDSIVGTEALVLTKFKDKIGPEIWQSKEAFKDWADKKLADITDWKKHPEYKSVDYPRYNEPRESGLQKWADFLKSEESGVQNDVFAQILFIDGITKEMKPDNAYTPPAISREIFEHTYNELLAGNTNVSITKEYAELNRKKAIEKYGTPTISEDGIKGTWVKIPRSQKGEPLYDEHVAMVQSLAEGSAWCLRFENAHGYLQQGDVHFFVDTNGNSQIAIDVLPDGKIYEMQRRYQQDGTVPIPYAVPIAQYLKENKFTGRERQVEDALKAKPEYDRQKIVFAKMAEEGNIIGIFKELNINVTVKEDGTYMIQSYTAFIPNKKYTISDLQIDKDKSFEDILFENVSEVRYTLNLNGSALKSAAKLKKVGSDINFGDNKANDLSSLEEINNKKVYWDK